MSCPIQASRAQQGRKQRILRRVKERRQRRLDDDHPVHDREPGVRPDGQQRQQRDRLRLVTTSITRRRSAWSANRPRERREHDPGASSARNATTSRAPSRSSRRRRSAGRQQHPVAGIGEHPASQTDRKSRSLSAAGASTRIGSRVGIEAERDQLGAFGRLTPGRRDQRPDQGVEVLDEPPSSRA